MRKMKLNVKVVAAFIVGAALAGSIATAAITPPTGTLKACADNRTQALFLSTTGTCSSSRTLVEIGGNGMNTKAISSLVTPSVVSISVSASSGSGTGSGSIYKSNSTSSYIITNNHVIDTSGSAATIQVELSNGNQYPAKIIGRDPGYDIAVLQIQMGNLPAVTLGDSSKVSVGDPVLAIGSPLGLASTVTSGIISALNRPVSTIATLSSGGTSGSIGLGFSIPINEAKRVIEEIIATGKSTRPVLGVYFDPTYTAGGAKIARLSANEGAEKAGIPVGAIIRSMDGFKIVDTDTAIVRIRSYAPGAVVTIVADLPTGGSKTFKVTLGSAPSL
jgi:putative serine protease PepD